MTRPNPNSMLHWWPALQDRGLPLPRTEIVRLPEPMRSEALLYACAEHGEVGRSHGEVLGGLSCMALLDTLVAPVAAACDRLGYPAFVRTDLMSGKHGWLDTCFVAAVDGVRQHLSNLVADQATHMWMNPDDAIAAFVVRELLDPQAPFTAFNGLPIGREFRYFVEDGLIVCRHAYWEDEENIESGVPRTATGKPVSWWREVLRRQSTLEAPSDYLLRSYATRASLALPGAWSVDFMWARRPGSGDGSRWWLIDCALAADSWHPEHAA